MNEMPKEVFHYCSLDTFYNIIKNKTLRLSDINCTNDYAERKWIIHYIREYIVSNTIPKFKYNTSIEHPIFVLDRRIENLCLQPVYPGYICCFSEESDLLSQWRGYANNGQGLCIGFNTDLLEKVMEIHKFFQFKKINYDIDILNNNIANKIDEWTNIYINGEGYVFTEDQENKLDLFLSMAVHSAFTDNGSFNKHNFFKEEKEWRIAFEDYSEMNRSIPNNLSMIEGYQNSNFSLSKLSSSCNNDHITTFLDLGFDLIKNKLITKIVIGPRSQLKISDIERFIIAEGYKPECIKILNSIGTYR